MKWNEIVNNFNFTAKADFIACTVASFLVIKLHFQINFSIVFKFNIILRMAIKG
jgi:hypothetical protein